MMQSVASACEESQNIVKKIRLNEPSSLPVATLSDNQENNCANNSQEETQNLEEFHQRTNEQIDYNSDNILEDIIKNENLGTLIVIYNLKNFTLNIRENLNDPEKTERSKIMLKEIGNFNYEDDRLLFEAIDNEELPDVILSCLHERYSYLFYNGCIFVELIDNRHFLTDKRFILLRPNTKTLLSDLEYLCEKNQLDKTRALYVEQALINRSQTPLYLGCTYNQSSESNDETQMEFETDVEDDEINKSNILKHIFLETNQIKYQQKVFNSFPIKFKFEKKKRKAIKLLGNEILKNKQTPERIKNDLYQMIVKKKFHNQFSDRRFDYSPTNLSLNRQINDVNDVKTKINKLIERQLEMECKNYNLIFINHLNKYIFEILSENLDEPKPTEIIDEKLLDGMLELCIIVFTPHRKNIEIRLIIYETQLKCEYLSELYYKQKFIKYNEICCKTDLCRFLLGSSKKYTNSYIEQLIECFNDFEIKIDLKERFRREFRKYGFTSIIQRYELQKSFQNSFTPFPRTVPSHTVPQNNHHQTINSELQKVLMNVNNSVQKAESIKQHPLFRQLANQQKSLLIQQATQNSNYLDQVKRTNDQQFKIQQRIPRINQIVYSSNNSNAHLMSAGTSSHQSRVQKNVTYQSVYNDTMTTQQTRQSNSYQETYILLDPKSGAFTQLNSKIDQKDLQSNRNNNTSVIVDPIVKNFANNNEHVYAESSTSTRISKPIQQNRIIDATKSIINYSTTLNQPIIGQQVSLATPRRGEVKLASGLYRINEPIIQNSVINFATRGEVIVNNFNNVIVNNHHHHRLATVTNNVNNNNVTQKKLTGINHITGNNVIMPMTTMSSTTTNRTTEIIKNNSNGAATSSNIAATSEISFVPNNSTIGLRNLNQSHKLNENVRISYPHITGPTSSTAQIVNMPNTFTVLFHQPSSSTTAHDANK